MLPANVRNFIEECESIASGFSSPELGTEFAHRLTSDAEDINAGRASVLLLAAPDELLTLIPDMQLLGYPGKPDGAPAFVLFDPEKSEMSRAFRRLADGKAGKQGRTPLSEAAPCRGLLADGAPTGIDGLRLLVAPSPGIRLSSPRWAAFLRHYVDVVVVSPGAAASGTLPEVAAALGDEPALALVLAPKPVDTPGATSDVPPRCVWTACPPDGGLTGLLTPALAGVLPLMVKHRCARMLDGWRRELQVEGERLAAIVQVRERVLAQRPAAPSAHGDESAANIRRTVQKFAESALSELEAELAAAEFAVPSEQIVPPLDDDDLIWREATLEGVRNAKRESRFTGRVPRRVFLLRAAPAYCDDIEKKVARATLERLAQDGRRIAKVLGAIETEVEQRLVGTGVRQSLPARLALARLPVLDGAVVRDEISVSAGNEEKLVRPGLIDIITLAQSGMNRVFGIIFSILMLAGGAAFKRLPEVTFTLLAILLGYVFFQWRQTPLVERQQVDEIKRKFKERIINSTESALRDSTTLRQNLHRQCLRKASRDLVSYWEQLDAALDARAAHALNTSSASAGAASAIVMHLKRNQARVANAVQHAAQCISSLAQPADAAFRHLTGALPPQPVTVTPTTVAQHLPPRPVAMPEVQVAPPRESPSRLGFPGRAGLSTTLRKASHD